MTRVEISRTKRLRRKSFIKSCIKNFCKKCLKIIGIAFLICAGILAHLYLWVGASNQNHERIEHILKEDKFYDQYNREHVR